MRGIRYLTDEEIKAILRAADELTATGGRGVIAKSRKGSKDKKVFAHAWINVLSMDMRRMMAGRRGSKREYR